MNAVTGTCYGEITFTGALRNPVPNEFQQKTTWIESGFCVSDALYIATLFFACEISQKM